MILTPAATIGIGMLNAGMPSRVKDTASDPVDSGGAFAFNPVEASARECYEWESIMLALAARSPQSWTAATAPTVRPDGTALATNDLYFNTALHTWNVYYSAAWHAMGGGGGGGSGDVVGPASATNNALAVFDGTTGKLLKNGVVATSNDTASTVVSRDGSGNFSAGTITASLTGNCSGTAATANVAGGAVGAVPYQSAASTTGLASANTTTTKKFLTETGTGTAGQAPAFDTIAAADLPVATTSALGAVKPDGSSITISAGVISSAGGTIATTVAPGIVMPDGTSIRVNTTTGLISATSHPWPLYAELTTDLSASASSTTNVVNSPPCVAAVPHLVEVEIDCESDGGTHLNYTLSAASGATFDGNARWTSDTVNPGDNNPCAVYAARTAIGVPTPQIPVGSYGTITRVVAVVNFSAVGQTASLLIYAPDGNLKVKAGTVLRMTPV
jgi:hypothetical protein